MTFTAFTSKKNREQLLESKPDRKTINLDILTALTNVLYCINKSVSDKGKQHNWHEKKRISDI